MPGYDYYMAGPFFDRRQLESMQRIEATLEGHGLKLFKPRYASDIKVVGPRVCFDDDCAGIRASKYVLANLIDDDPGTMFEIGYAFALGKKVFGILEGCSEGDAVNLMIAESLTELFVSVDDLESYLSTGSHRRIGLREF